MTTRSGIELKPSVSRDGGTVIYLHKGAPGDRIVARISGLSLGAGMGWSRFRKDNMRVMNCVESGKSPFTTEKSPKWP